MTEEITGPVASPQNGRYAERGRTLSRRTVLQGAAGTLALPAIRALTGGLPASRTVVARESGRRVGPPRHPTGTLRAAISAEPNFINPADALELYEYAVVRSVYDGLTQWNTAYNKLEPALAVSWGSNADATEWEFHLRPDVKFQDGTPFNSAAVRRSIEEYIPNAWGVLYANLKTIDDSHPLVLKVGFSEPSPDFGRNQTFVKVISPKLLKENAAAKRAVGTGAFEWVTWEHGRQINLRANPNYWGKPEPYIRDLDLIIVQDETARVDGLVSGSLGLIMEVDPHDIPSIRSDRKLALATSPTWEELNLTYRCDQPIVNDVRVRQAIAYGINREAIVKDVLLGAGVVADSPLPYGTYGHITPDIAYSSDPAKSRQHLKAAGYPKGISLNLAGASSLATIPLMGQAMVAMLAEAGITVNFEIMEAGVLVSDLLAPHPKHQLFIITYGWVNGGPFQFDVLNVLNHPQYKGAALTKLIVASNSTADGPKRLKYLSDAQNLFMQQLPHLPLYDATDTDAFEANVHGYEVPRDAYQPVFARTYL